MANELKTIITADTSQFVNQFKNIKGATNVLTDVVNKAKEAGKSFMGADGDAQKFAKSLGNLGTSATSSKRQLGEITNAINDIKSAYNQLSDEEKHSAFGVALQDSMNQLIERAGVLKDNMMDTAQAIRNASSDTRAFDQIAAGVGLVANGMQLASGAAVLFGKENKKLIESMARLQAIMAVVNAAQGIQNALQKQGALVQGLKSIATRLNTALLVKNTTAINANTAATEANTASKTKATAAVGGLNTKLIALRGAFTAAAGEAVVLGGALAALVAGTIGLSVGVRKLIEYYKREHNPTLKAAYEQEQKLAEIKEAVADKTADQMTKLNYYIETLGNAKRGSEEYKNAENELCKMADTLNAAVIKKKDGLIDLTATYDNLAASIFNAAVQQALFEQNAEDMKKLLKLQQEKVDLEKKYNKEVKSGSSHYTGGTMAGTGSQFGFIGNTGTMTTVKDADVTKAKIDEVTKSIKEQEDAINSRTKAANSLFKNVTPATPPKKSGGGGGSHSGSNNDTNPEKDPITKELKKVDLSNAGISWETLFPSETAKLEADKIWENFRKELMQIMDKQPLQGKIELLPVDINPDNLKSEARDLSPLQKFGMSFKETFNPKDVEGTEGLFSTMGNSIGFAADQLSRVSDAMSKLGQSNKTLQSSVLVAQTLATLSLSFAQAMSKESKTGVWGWIAAGIAGTAQLLAMTAQLKSINKGGYATGGIIPGNSYYGDRLVANVNSGEMILNRRQQSNLFNMINKGQSDVMGGSKVEFEIRYDSLVGVLENGEKRNGKF